MKGCSSSFAKQESKINSYIINQQSKLRSDGFLFNPRQNRDSVMKIAIACHNGKNITEHTGRCRRFWIYQITRDNITGKDLLELSKEQTFHEYHESDGHPLDDIRVLISGGMGQGLYRRLEAKGIDVFITKEEDPDQALMKYLSGSLETGEPHKLHHCHHE